MTGNRKAEASPDLLVLRRWEEHTTWILEATNRWPKSMRFTLTQRIQQHALDVIEMLVQARYEPLLRQDLLHETNLRLERMRHIFRCARDLEVCPAKGFERAMMGIDEVGRMVHGWRKGLGVVSK
jgi:hypothetical protein